jgi:hypothetical protein
MSDITDLIIKETPVGWVKRVFSVPILRGEKNRLSDLSAEIYKYAPNGIEDMIDELRRRDKGLGEDVHNTVYHDYVKQQLDSHRASIIVAEINDTYDKLAAIGEIAAELSVAGMPVAFVHKVASSVGPVAALATMYFDTVARNKDPETRREQATFFAKAAIGLALIEGSEFLPIAGELANIADTIDLYIMAANQTIAHGTSRKQFEEYFQKNHPGLYSEAYGNVIDVVAKDVPEVPPELPPAPPGEPSLD